MESIGPLVVASVAATLLTRAVTGDRALYAVPHFRLDSVWEMGPYLILGLVVGGLAPWFLRSLRRAEKLFLIPRWPIAVRLMAGGLVVGALAIRVPEVCGNGYSVVLDILNGRLAWELVIIVLVCKWIATAASFGSGAPGGVFTPSLFMGASAGYLFGWGVHSIWPAGASDPQAFALVGMGSFLSAATRAPVMAVILLFEMTASYDIILPLMLCSVVAFYASRGIESRSLYSEALRRKGERRPEPKITSIKVEELMKRRPPQVKLRAGFAQVVQEFMATRVNNLYVVDDEGALAGVVALHDIKSFLPDTDLAPLMIAQDLMRTDFPHLSASGSLADALGGFLATEAHRLPVVDDGHRLVGSLAKNDLLLALDEGLRRKDRPGTD
jgi:CIC family chloride channel protein